MYQLTLGYDNVGRIGTKTESVSGVAHTFDYTHDVDGQLYEVRRDGILVEQYGYDNNANRTSTLAATATYDEQDRLIQQGGLSYTFDTDGYLVQRGSDTFSYSSRGELLSATISGQTITYHYDGMGRRVGKTDTAGVSQYLYGNPNNPFQVTASRDAAGNLTTYFYDTAGNLFSFERSGQRYYVTTDHLGTPKTIADATGTVIKAVEYDSWGVKLSDSNQTFELPVGFAGGIPETTTGMVRFGFRDYEPATGRWSSRDPILFRGRQANLYVYIANTPTNYRDPSGLWYFDLNVSYGTRFFLGWTGGMLINDKGIYPYFGGGIVSPGASGSFTWSESDPTPGWNVGYQFQAGIARQVGHSLDPCNRNPYAEVGAGWPVGFSITGYYVFGPFTPVEPLPAP